MKVYVISRGEYDDYHICAVTLSKRKAKVLQERFTMPYDEAFVEIYDTKANKDFIKLRNQYCCSLTEDGIKISERREHKEALEYCGEVRGPKRHPYVIVMATNKQEAQNKALQLFEKWKSENPE